MRRASLAILVLLFFFHNGVGSGRGQNLRAPARVTLKIGAAYDQGDFGRTDLSKAMYVPVSLRYSGRRFDVGVGSAFARVVAASGVRLLDGAQTQTGGNESPLQDSGVADTVVRSRIFAYTAESGVLPSVTPFVKIKIPTGALERGLGTGKADYALGIELDRPVGPISLFGDGSYTAIGKVSGLNLRNRPAASVGLAGRVVPAVTLSGALDWRRALIAGNSNPAEFSGAISYRASPTVTLTPNAFVGLSDGSSNFGLGMQLSFRFGRS